jgi:hypothetical protein
MAGGHARAEKRRGGVNRRVAALVPLALAFGTPHVEAAGLPKPDSLATALAAALHSGHPLVVLASLDGCPFCRLVRDNYLAPLQRDDGLPVVQIDRGSKAAVLDFSGTATTHEQLLRRWNVPVTPTVLFFGRQAREVAERLVGASPDFYSAYLDQRLGQAHGNLR